MEFHLILLKTIKFCVDYVRMNTHSEFLIYDACALPYLPDMMKNSSMIQINIQMVKNNYVQDLKGSKFRKDKPFFS